jgi:hypothetical protein
MRRADKELLKFVFHGFPPPEPTSDASSRDAEDLLPEDTNYQDKGCLLSPSCLSCPFTDCVEDQARGGYRLAIQQRNAEICRLFLAEKKTHAQLASQFGLGLSTVKRITGRRAQNP